MTRPSLLELDEAIRQRARRLEELVQVGQFELTVALDDFTTVVDQLFAYYGTDRVILDACEALAERWKAKPTTASAGAALSITLHPTEGDDDDA